MGITSSRSTTSRIDFHAVRVREAGNRLRVSLAPQAPVDPGEYKGTVSVGYQDGSGTVEQIAAAAEQQTGVKTSWFDLTIDVSVAGSDLSERALIDATTLPARLVSRQWGEIL